MNEMKELSELKNEFYEVMYKYEKSFSEKGVMADLTAWQTAKADLLSLLRRHPDWNEAEQAIIFDCNQALSIQPDTVDETAFTLLDIASEILSGEQLEDFRTALHAAVSGYSRTVSEENLEILRQRGGIRCTKDQKASRIIGKLCKKYGVDRHDRYNAVFAQLADALNPLIMQETGAKANIRNFRYMQENYTYKQKIRHAENVARSYQDKCSEMGLNCHVSVGGRTARISGHWLSTCLCRKKPFHPMSYSRNAAR